MAAEGDSSWVPLYQHRGYKPASALNVGLSDTHITVAIGARRATAPTLICGRVQSVKVIESRLRLAIETEGGPIIGITVWRHQEGVALLWKEGS